MRFTFAIFFALVFGVSFAQNCPGHIITNQNDTIAVEIIKPKAIIMNNRVMELQEKIVTVEGGKQKEYTPKDIRGYDIKMGDDHLIFDNMNGMYFAQRFHSGKVKLHKYIKKVESFSNPGIFRIYMLRKPGQEQTYNMVAMGLSRLLTKKTMLPVFEDCPVIYEKIKADDIEAVKIKDEAKLVEFIKLYEADCFGG